MKRFSGAALILAFVTAPSAALARYYDPELGIFLSEDKAPGMCADVPSLHKYAYARVNPLRYIDPDGNAANDGYGECPQMPGGVCPHTSGAAWAGMGEATLATAPLVYSTYKQGIRDVSVVVENATDASSERALAPFDNAPWLVRKAAYASNFITTVNTKAAGQIAVGIAGIGLLPETLYHSKAEFDSAQDQLMSGVASGNSDKTLRGFGRLSGVVGLWAGIAAGTAEAAPRAPWSVLADDMASAGMAGLKEGFADVYANGPAPSAVDPFTPSSITKYDPRFAVQQILEDPLPESWITPEGRQLTPHAAERMVNPPKGRVPMSKEEVDQVLSQGNLIRKVSPHPEGDTITVRNSKMPGSPEVVVDADTGQRVITVVNPKSRK